MNAPWKVNNIKSFDYFFDSVRLGGGRRGEGGGAGAGRGGSIWAVVEVFAIQIVGTAEAPGEKEREFLRRNQRPPNLDCIG